MARQDPRADEAQVRRKADLQRSVNGEPDTPRAASRQMLRSALDVQLAVSAGNLHTARARTAQLRVDLTALEQSIEHRTGPRPT